jgi:hypothetical protein
MLANRVPTKHRVQMERGCHISGHRDQFLASAGARGRPVRARAPLARLVHELALDRWIRNG